MGIVVVFTLLSRLLLLHHHQLNHDESIYVLDSLRYLRDGYRFDPEQHGPFLFFLNMMIFRLLGATDATVLLGPAILGVVLVVLPLLLLGIRGIDPLGAVLSAALLAASPSFLYFSRMMKTDIYLAAFLMGVVVFGVRYAMEDRPADLRLAAACLGLLFATRVDAIIHVVAFVCFWVIRAVITRGAAPGGPLPAARLEPRVVASSCAICLSMYLVFYAVFPWRLDGAWDHAVALVRFWWDRHQANLLSGPATYYLQLMMEYELPVLAVFFIGLRRHLERTRRMRFVFRSAFLLFAFMFGFGTWRLPLFGRYLHAGTVREVSFLAYWAFLGAWGTVALLRHGHLFSGFLCYWGTVSNLFYAYAGEKQPQIVLFPLLPVSVLAGIFLSEWIRTTEVGRWRFAMAVGYAVAFAWYLYTSIVVSFVTYYFPSERLSNAATSPDIVQLRALLARTSEETGLGKVMPVKFMFAFTSDVLAWYLRDFPNRLYSHRLEAFYPVIIFYNYTRYEYRELLDRYYEHRKIHTNLGSGYHRGIVWWPPRALLSGLSREVRFQFFRWTFRPVPGAYVDVYTRRRGQTISEEDERRREAINEVFQRRAVPVIAQFGGRGALLGELNGASDIAIDREMNLYVAETANGRVTKFGKDGKPLLTIQDGHGAFAPQGLGLCEAQDSLYVTVPAAHEVRQYRLNGAYVRSIAHPFTRPTDATCDGDGSLLVLDESPRQVVKFDRDGRVVAGWAIQPSLFKSPVSIVVARATGEILVADLGRRKLARLRPDGRHRMWVDLPGISEAQPQLYFDVDEAGRLFVPDLSNSRVIVLEPSGRPVMVIGEESRGYGGMVGPLSVAVRGDALYVYSRVLERITGYRLDGVPRRRSLDR